MPVVPYSRIELTDDRVVLYVFIEKKNLYLNGHVQFKPVLRGQMYCSASVSELYILVPAPSLSLNNL